MTEIPAFYGVCEIASLVTYPNPFVGIMDSGLDTASVLLNQPGVIWSITSQPEDQGLRFSTGRFPFTGVDNGTSTVISTLEEYDDVQWYVSYREVQKAYTIEAGYDRSQVWTVSDASDPSSPIVVSTIKIIISEPSGPRYLPDQLFNPVQLGSLN